MFKHLLDIIKEMKGNVLTIGIDEKLLTGFNKNNLVNVFTLDKSPNTYKKRKKRKSKTGKEISISRLYKYFKKKSIDYVICDYDEIKDYIKYVFRDIVKINSKKLYVYCMEEDVELIKVRFKRYGSKIKVTKFKDKVLLEIDNSKSKTNWFKNKVYFILDTGYNLVEFISNVLVG